MDRPYPFSPRCGLVLARFLGQNGPFSAASIARTAELAASWASFCLPTFRSWNFHRFEGGGRQLLHFGVGIGPKSTPNARFGTHGRHFGPVASSDFIFGSDRPIFHQRHSISLASRGHFRASDLETPELHGLRPRGRQLWVSPADFGFKLGPKLTFGTHDRPNTNKQP